MSLHLVGARTPSKLSLDRCADPDLTILGIRIGSSGRVSQILLEPQWLVITIMMVDSNKKRLRLLWLGMEKIINLGIAIGMRREYKNEQK